MVFAGILGRSVLDSREKLLSARELNDKFRLGEKQFKTTKDAVLAVPSEGKMIVTDASSTDFSEAHQVNFTDALANENFLEACRSEFDEAIRKSSEKIISIKIDPRADDDEPSDEAIKKLLLVIDEHQQFYPRSRLMITTDGDRLLYERILNFKLQHDAR